MPELPEVEAHRRNLERWLGGRTVRAIRAPSGRTFRRTRPSTVRRHLRGRRVREVLRRGKLLLVHLDGSVGLIAHLGMTGRFLRRPADAPRPPHTRATLVLDDGAAVHFVCPRTLGWLETGPIERLTKASPWSRLGPDPLRDPFGPDVLGRALAGTRASVKSALMDQRRLAGLGNIQAAEALWRAGIDPRRPASDLSTEEIRALTAAIQASVDETLQALSEEIVYLSAGGPNPFRVYGRADAPCPRCGQRIVRIVLSGRSTFLCPGCQR